MYCWDEDSTCVSLRSVSGLIESLEPVGQEKAGVQFFIWNTWSVRAKFYVLVVS